MFIPFHACSLDVVVHGMRELNSGELGLCIINFVKLVFLWHI